MKILMINQDWFAAEWRAAGHEVLVAGSGDQCDIRFPVPLVRWEALCAMAPNGPFIPDRIIVHDNSSPIMVSGLDEAAMPTAFYSVDVHHHLGTHRYYAGSFDHTFVAQKDYIPGFHEVGESAEWLPLWASRVVEAQSEKRYPAVFVGTMDPALNPDRVAFFNELKTRVPLVIERGEYWNIFPYAHIVMNQTVKGDLNFRVFEAMMCGGMLLTESSGNGLFELFKADEHLIAYQKGDVAEAAQKIEKYLADPELCGRIAKQGRDEILRAHLPQHRAQTVLARLEGLQKRQSSRRHFGMVMNFSVLSASFEDIDNATTTRALLLVLKAAYEGMLKNEAMTGDLACHVVLSCVRYDQKVPGRSGAELMRKMMEAYPTEMILTLGVIRDHLNCGERDLAHEIAAKMGPQDPAVTFELAERILSELLSKISKK